MNFVEKMQIFMNLITNSQLLMGTIVLIALLILLFLNKQISKKKLFRAVLFVNVGSFIILLYLNYEKLINIYNNIIDKIFMNLYFPSIEIYLFILLFMIIVLFVSLFNFKMRKSYKITNIISFFSFFYLFLMLVSIVVNNNINIFDASSVYTNKEAVAILELSTLVYVLWLTVILIIGVSNTIYLYILNRRKSEAKSVVDDSVELLRQEAYIVPEKKEEDKVTPVEPKISVVPIMEAENNINKYSLQDYRIFNSMLKQVIILNSYKPKITLNDLLDDNMLSIFSKEDVVLYKKILLNTLN